MLAFLSSRFPIWPESQGKKLNISNTKRAFKKKQKIFFIIFKDTRNCLRPKGRPLKKQLFANVLQNRSARQFHKSHCKTPKHLLIKFQRRSLQLYERSASATSVLLWILWNSKNITFIENRPATASDFTEPSPMAVSVPSFVKTGRKGNFVKRILIFTLLSQST